MSLPFALVQNLGPAEIIIIFCAIGSIVYGLSLICLVHCAMNKKMNGTTKAVWILVVFLIPIFGPVAYLIGGRDP